MRLLLTALPLSVALLLAVPQAARGQVPPDTSHLVPASAQTASAPVSGETGQAASSVSPGATHQVPFASRGNAIALAVANTADRPAAQLRVKVKRAPSWLQMDRRAVTLEAVDGGTEAVARFAFSVAEDAPTNEPAELGFEVTSERVVIGQKTIRLKVDAPSAFALSGNYPNPFRRQTRIGYQLPEAAKVTISIYDALGRRVAQIDEGRKEAGGHAAAFQAGGLSSGAYFYTVEARLKSGERRQETGRMVLVR